MINVYVDFDLPGFVAKTDTRTFVEALPEITQSQTYAQRELDWGAAGARVAVLVGDAGLKETIDRQRLALYDLQRPKENLATYNQPAYHRFCDRVMRPSC